MSVWWLVCGGVLILGALAVAQAHIRLTTEVDQLEAALRSTVELGDRAGELRRAIEAARSDAAERRDRLTARTPSPSASRLQADR